MRSLRRGGPRPDLFEEGPDFVTRHAEERLSLSKCLAAATQFWACASK